MRIDELLQEVTVRRRLLDWIRKPLYHVTTLESAAMILKSNKMVGSLSAFEPSGTYNSSASPFYVSMATTRDGQYGLGMMKSMKPVVMFEFKGMKEFETSTLNYWEHEDNQYGAGQGKAFYKVHTEHEKRVYLKSRNLDNVKKYINRVDVAFYADNNFPSNSRKLLRIINEEFPKARYHKTMSGLLTASKGVSFEEIMSLVSSATDQTSLFSNGKDGKDGKDDAKLLQEIINAKKRGISYNIGEKRFWSFFGRAGLSDNQTVVRLFTELNQMFTKAKMADPLISIHMWVRGKK